MIKFIMPTFLFNIERWKWNDEYRIYVSNMGHFKDEYKRDLAIKLNTKGYCNVLTSAGWRSAHRLVMFTWRPIPDAENLTVDHLDHNKRNNALSNLEWVTEKENISRARRDQLLEEKKKESPVTIQIERINIINTKQINGLTDREKNQQVDNKNNYSKPVTDGHNVFKNANEAAIYYMKNRNDLKGTSSKKVERRIISAIFYKKKYMDTKWFFVEEE